METIVAAISEGYPVGPVSAKMKQLSVYRMSKSIEGYEGGRALRGTNTKP
jgi:hypothetical protein